MTLAGAMPTAQLRAARSLLKETGLATCRRISVRMQGEGSEYFHWIGGCALAEWTLMDRGSLRAETNEPLTGCGARASARGRSSSSSLNERLCANSSTIPIPCCVPIRAVGVILVKEHRLKVYLELQKPLFVKVKTHPCGHKTHSNDYA